MRNVSAFQPKGTTKAYYPLNGSSTDFSGNGNHGTDTAITYPQGRFGQGAKFNGSSSKISVSSNLGITGGAITMAGWFKLNTEIGSGEYTLAYQFDGGTDTGYALMYQYNAGTRRIEFRRIKQGVGFQGPTYNLTMGTSNLYHIAITYDATNVNGYVNGALVGGPTAASGNGTGSIASLFCIGAYEGTSAYSANIADEVIIESRAWTAKEVETYYRKSTMNYKQKSLWQYLLSFVISETTSLTESITNLRQRIFSTSETTTLTESVSSALGKIFEILESVSLAETFTSIRTFAFNIAESIGLTEIKAQVKKKWNNVAKSVSTWTNRAKNSSIWSNRNKS